MGKRPTNPIEIGVVVGFFCFAFIYAGVLIFVFLGG